MLLRHDAIKGSSIDSMPLPGEYERGTADWANPHTEKTDRKIPLVLLEPVGQ